MTAPVYYSPKEAAVFVQKRLGVVFCEKRIRGLVRAGKLPRLQGTPGRVYIRDGALVAYFSRERGGLRGKRGGAA
jgi:hypothetical protein